MLRSSADGSFTTYIITKHPEVGAIQLSKGKFELNLTASGEREFSQQDIDEGLLKYIWKPYFTSYPHITGLIRYVHGSNERGGRFYFRFNVMGESGNSLTDQNFEIIVIEDTVSPSVIVNAGKAHIIGLSS